MGATHVDTRKEKKKVLKFVKIFWSAIAKREVNFFWILLLGMSRGFIILTLKKNDWAWNTGTLHLLARKNSKECRLPTRFFWLFFWDSQRVYMTEFLEAVKTVNSARYIETIKNLRRRVCRVRGSTSWILLLHENARPHTARSRLMLWRRWSLRFSPIRPTTLTWRQAISISFLTSRGISRGLISPQMMKWSKLWRRGWNKELLNFSLTACVNLFYVGKNVLNDKATMSKNKYVNL